MSEKQTLEALSTPQQADGILKQIAELTVNQGNYYPHAAAFGEHAITVPDVVAEHFPPLEDDSLSGKRTIYVTQGFSHLTGRPRRIGVVGIVSFGQSEQRDPGLIYSTNVNYHVVSNRDSGYTLERHVRSNEYGKAAVAEHVACMTTGPIAEALAEAIALQTRVYKAKAIEAGLGLNSLTAIEAQKISETLAGLIGDK